MASLGERYAPTSSGRTLPYWFEDQPPLLRPPLRADLDVDVAVVGAGLAGTLCAYRLAVAGRRVALLEDRAIGAGESGRTTAHFTHALDDRYWLLERLHGRRRTRWAAQSHTLAMDEVERIVREERIACDLARVPGYLFLHPSDKPRNLQRELAACRRSGLEVDWLEGTPGLQDAGPCIRFPRQVELHPTKLMAGLVERIEREGGAVHCGSRVEQARGGLASNGHRVRARSTLACTNVPFHTKLKWHAKQAAYRTYVVAGPVSGAVPRALWWDTGDQQARSVAPPYHYVRTAQGPAGRVLIVGGEDHKTGQPGEGDPFARLEAWTRARFPLRSVTHAWSGQVVEPFDRLAFIGADPGARRRGIATGDSGNGMTHAVVASIVLAAQATGSPPPAWAAAYDPRRKPGRAVAAFMKHALDGSAQYMDYVRTPGPMPDLAPGEGTVRRGPAPKAVYRDEGGALHSCSAVCPHLGCIVRWNPLESSFDCPCHGSRFSPLGQRVNGPSDADLKPAAQDSRPRRAARRPRRRPVRAGTRTGRRRVVAR
jgi:glycine/D-amino acid oxidase-like deaminating enzyme/nitrite reductase/ring-hydroxylating ferredoxin subunit